MNHQKITGVCAVVTALAVLLGCGGSRPQSIRAPARTPAPTPAPPSLPSVPPPPEISPEDMLEDLLEPGKPDWLFLSDMIGDVSYFGIHLGDIRIESSCEDGSCTAVKGTITSESEPTEEFEIGETLTVDDFATDDVFEGGATPLGDVSTRTLHGMNLVHVEYLASGDTADLLGSGDFWGGWLEHQMFGVFSGRDHRCRTSRIRDRSRHESRRRDPYSAPIWERNLYRSDGWAGYRGMGGP